MKLKELEKLDPLLVLKFFSSSAVDESLPRYESSSSASPNVKVTFPVSLLLTFDGGLL